MPRRSSSEFDPLSLVMALMLGLFVLVLALATGNRGLLGIAPGGRLQLGGQGRVAYQALTATSREFGSRAFRVREGDTVSVTYSLQGSGASARLSISLCGYNPLKPDCSLLYLERLYPDAEGAVTVVIPRRGRCDVDLWVRDYTGTVALSWERR
jgi:hypothetical protein